MISVVMPVYNAERYVGDAIRSIQAQSYRRWELLVVNDGSDDGTAAVVHDLAADDTRIRMLTVPHRGRARAANVGADAARGEMIARMDADDVALPDRFAVQLDWMRKTGVEICCSWMKRFGDHDGLLWFPEAHEDIARESLFRAALLSPTVLTHAAVLKVARYSEHASYTDYELWTRLLLKYRAGNVPAVLVKHRCHARQAHIVEAAGFRADLRTYRRPLFQALYPDADARDGATVDQIAETVPFSSVSDLDRAGEWLLRLAQSPDLLLRRRMLERWQRSCLKSAHLGLDAYRSYARISPQFGVGPAGGEARLRAACALRLKSDSRLDRGLRGVTRASRRLLHEPTDVFLVGGPSS